MCFETVCRCSGCGADLGYIINYCGKGDCDSVNTVVDDSGDCGQCHTPPEIMRIKGVWYWGLSPQPQGGGGEGEKGGKLPERT